MSPLQNRIQIDLDQIFIGRQNEMLAFPEYVDRWLATETSDYASGTVLQPSPQDRIQALIVLIHGRGGFGKSTLLRKYRKTASEFDNLKVGETVDWEHVVRAYPLDLHIEDRLPIDPDDYYRLLVFQLASSLAKKPTDFKHYQKAAKRVAKARRKAEAALKGLRSDDRFAWLRDMASDGVVLAIKEFVPGAATVLNDDRSASISKLLSQGVKVGASELAAARDAVQRRLGDYYESFRAPQLVLAKAIGEDLRMRADHERILLFFDTYEEVDEADHLLQLVMYATGPAIGWVIACRTNLWAGRDLRLRHGGYSYGYRDLVNSDLALSIAFGQDDGGEFSTDEIELYFKKVAEVVERQPLDQSTAEAIRKVTHGVPLAVRIAAGIYLDTGSLEAILNDRPAGEDELVAVMVERYLLHTKASLHEKKRIYGLAMIRRNASSELVGACLGLTPDNLGMTYSAELRRLHRRYSFIFGGGEQPSLHRDVRFFLRKWLSARRTTPEVRILAEELYDWQYKRVENDIHETKGTTPRSRFSNGIFLQQSLDAIELFFWINPGKAIRLALQHAFLSAAWAHPHTADVFEVVDFFIDEIDEKGQEIWSATHQSLVPRNSRSATAEQQAALEKLFHITKANYLTESNVPRLAEPALLSASIGLRLAESLLDSQPLRAFEMANEVLSVTPDDLEVKFMASEAAYLAGTASYRQGNEKKAIELWDKAAALDPGNPEIPFRIGRAYTNLGDEDTATVYFDRSLEIEGGEASALRGLASAFRYKDINRAQGFAHRSVQVAPDDPESLDYLGLLLRDTKKYEDAYTSHLRAFELEASPVTGFYLALLALRQENKKDAHDHMSSALSLLDEKEAWAKRLRPVWNNLIHCCAALLEKDYEKATSFARLTSSFATTARTRQAVLSHLEFFLDCFEPDLDTGQDLLSIVKGK